jgi:DNA-binding NtrC family response regulator
MNSSKENNRRVLVIDDDADILELMRMLLTSMDWEVTAVSTVAGAFEELAAAPHFLVITDIAMPEMDGFELVNAVKEMGYQCRFALMTGFGYDKNHTIIKVRKTFKYPCFSKPFENDVVTKVVNDAFSWYHGDL